MPEAKGHFSDHNKDIVSFCMGEFYGKLFLYFLIYIYTKQSLGYKLEFIKEYIRDYRSLYNAWLVFEVS